MTRPHLGHHRPPDVDGRGRRRGRRRRPRPHRPARSARRAGRAGRRLRRPAPLLDGPAGRRIASTSTPESDLDPAVAARLKRSADGLVPAVVQQHDTGEVLMLGWMDDEALARTLTHRAGDLLVALPRRSTGSRARPPVTSSASRRSASTATATPCSSRSTRRGRPATPATAPASTPTCCWPPMAERDARSVPTLGAGRRRSGPGRGRRDQGLGDVRRDGRRGRGRRHRWRGRPDAPGHHARRMVVLAAWGVVLVTRGRVRRTVAVLGAAGLDRRARHGRVRRGGWCRDACATPPPTRASTPSASTWPGGTGWPWSVRSCRAAAHGAGGLPGRALARDGHQYDSPDGRAGATPAEEPSHLDLWKSLDEGRDPTA